MPAWLASPMETLPPVLARNAAERPGKVALVCENEPVTYAEMDRRSTAWANSLRELGVRPGDRVAVLMDNSPEIIYSWFACSKLGAIHVPLNTALHGEFLRHQLATADPRVLVVDAGLVGAVSAVAAGLSGLQHLVVKEGSDLPTGLHLPAHVSLTRGTGQLLDADDGSVPGAEGIRWDQPCAILFTSGTTGRSKGVVLSQNYLVQIARGMVNAAAFGSDSVWYQPSPLFHINACATVVLGPALVGGTGCTERKFSASRYWDRVRHFGASHISFLTFAVMLWKQPERDDDADNPVRIAMGTAIPADLHVGLERRFGLKILKQYGLSEACVSPLVSTVSDPSPPGFSGKPNPLMDVRLFDEHDQEVPTGSVGEIVIRPRAAHVMFDGYFNDPAATVAAWRNGWFHTGDLGRAAEGGWIAFVDRKKDYVRRRGENVSSVEVESVLVTHAAVAATAVHGVPSEVGEEELKACVVLEDGLELTQAEFWEFCVTNLPGFAVPRYVEVMKTLPRNQTGRVMKDQLRSRGITLETWDNEALRQAGKRDQRV